MNEPTQSVRRCQLVFLVGTLALVLCLTGCATGPIGSHGVDYIPAFDTAPPNQ